jgi:glycosyltransferase involved in cell wall biosynthesis
MKLIIQIPCLNEAETLPATVADLPRQVQGFEAVEWMVVDDGSTDGTAEVARALGVDHVVRMNGNQGLARAFMAGLVAATERGADVIVNTDADNQYCAADLGALVAPIVAGRADIVIGARPIKAIRHFSPAKRLLQVLGSRVVRALSGADVGDAPSGFRAMTRDAALRLNVFGDFTYTIETVIQAGLSNLRITSVPVRVNAPTRPSRLFRSMAGYVRRSLLTMLSVYLIYRPARIFGALALGFFAPGAVLALRYLALMATGEGKGHVQSVIASGVLGLCAVFMAAIGIVAHLQSINRRLLEEIRYLERSRRVRERFGPPPGDDPAPTPPRDHRAYLLTGEGAHG